MFFLIVLLFHFSFIVHMWYNAKTTKTRISRIKCGGGRGFVCTMYKCSVGKMCTWLPLAPSFPFGVI